MHSHGYFPRTGRNEKKTYKTGLRFVLFCLFIKDACTAYRIFFVFFFFLGGVVGRLFEGGAYSSIYGIFEKLISARILNIMR